MCSKIKIKNTNTYLCVSNPIFISVSLALLALPNLRNGPSITDRKTHLYAYTFGNHCQTHNQLGKS